MTNEYKYCYYVAYTAMVKNQVAMPAHMFGGRTIWTVNKIDTEEELLSVQKMIEEAIYTANAVRVNVIILNWKQLGGENESS